MTDDLITRLQKYGHRPHVICIEAADRIKELEAENARLRRALEEAEAWIVDGGHVDDDDARNGGTGARSVCQAIRAALSDQQPAHDKRDNDQGADQE